ncbi:MAG: hypothetical protein ABS69_19690 [Nitrosomonadales bacterium SCN 54-20]|nr:MAG: hypothetical protein ABS69_19690 [Nitrosomonadales bacterium SCN 54-20]
MTNARINARICEPNFRAQCQTEQQTKKTFRSIRPSTTGRKGGSESWVAFLSWLEQYRSSYENSGDYADLSQTFGCKRLAAKWQARQKEDLKWLYK